MRLAVQALLKSPSLYNKLENSKMNGAAVSTLISNSPRDPPRAAASHQKPSMAPDFEGKILFRCGNSQGLLYIRHPHLLRFQYIRQFGGIREAVRV